MKPGQHNLKSENLYIYAQKMYYSIHSYLQQFIYNIIQFI